MALIAYWGLDESTGLVASDSSGNGYTGTLVNMSTTAWVAGKYGNCLTFDGSDDYVAVADNDAFSFGNSSADSPFTVCAWINSNNIGSGYFDAVAKGSEWGLFLHTNGKLAFELRDNSAGPATIGRIYNTAFTSEYNGTWIFIAGTYSGSGLASGIGVYFNGTKVDDANYSDGSYTAMENLATTLYVGSNGARWVNGKIDDVKIFNTQLSDAEILNLYNDVSASLSPSLSPSQSPSSSPSLSPSVSPSTSTSPSLSPSNSPSLSPSQSPSPSPSLSPSNSPSLSPSQSPSPSPSLSPSNSPSLSPSQSPSQSPSLSPSQSPSLSPSLSPSTSPSPSLSPSISPSISPSTSVSASPSVSPSASPSWEDPYIKSTTVWVNLEKNGATITNLVKHIVD